MKYLSSINISVVLIICLFNLLIFLPGLINPSIITARNNDLSNFFISNVIFVKNQIVQNHEIPLWNNLILSGTPILPDPQSPVFYIPNVLFLFLPVDDGFVFMFFIHNFFSGLFMYILCKNGFKLKKSTSLLAAILYLLNPKVITYVETGHYGLFTIFTWIPLLIYSLIKIIETQKLIWGFLLALSLSLIYFSHLVTFGIIYFFLFVLFFMLANKKINKKVILIFILSNFIFLGFIAGQLLPQLEWKDQTTRFLLIQNPDIYPKWNSKLEFIKATLSPLLFSNNIINLDTEKWISYGTFSVLLFIFAIAKVKFLNKFIALFILFSLSLLIANNVSPIYNLILSFKPLIILRVMSRFWIINYLIILTGAIWTIESCIKNRNFQKFIFIIVSLAIIELLLINWTRFYKPINQPSSKIPKSFITFIKKDPELFRVFCLSGCIPQKTNSLKNIETIDGYNTLQQKDYNQQMWQFTGKYWNYYSLSSPPYGIYLEGINQPDILALGDYNMKYLISNTRLDVLGLIEKKQENNYYLYQNSKYMPRIYYRNNNEKIEIISYKPNEIIFKTTPGQKNIIIANSYNNNWKAYLNGKYPVEVLKTPSNLQQVSINSSTQFVKMKYLPTTFLIGLTISFITYISFFVYLLFSVTVSKMTKTTPIHKA